MSLVDPAQRALYARLEEVLGADNAETLMTHLPPTPGARLATVEDLAQGISEVDRRFADVDRRFEDVDRRFDEIVQRFDKMDHRFDRLEDRFLDMHETLRDQMRFYSGTTVAAMTSLTAIYAFVVSLLT